MSYIEQLFGPRKMVKFKSRQISNIPAINTSSAFEVSNDTMSFCKPGQNSGYPLRINLFVSSGVALSTKPVDPIPSSQLNRAVRTFHELIIPFEESLWQTQ